MGEAKNTYGTGNFLLLNTGTDLVVSKSGLLTTVGYKIGDQDAIYCLEGSVAITGALVQWLRDNLKMIKAAPEVEELAQTVEDNGGCYVVPAFSGLFAPYWKSNARGVIAGLTRYVNAGHIARATLEATAYQSREIVEAMNADSGVELESLKVDGGMVGNDLLMQFQADLLGVPVIRPKVPETTSLGAAYAAGLATGSGASRRTCARTGSRTSAGSRPWTPTSATSTSATGRRRSRARSTGSTRTTTTKSAGGRGGVAVPAAGSSTSNQKERSTMGTHDDPKPRRSDEEEHEPDFARGEAETDPHEREPDFARGIAETDPDKHGRFSTGEEQLPDSPEKDREGRFSDSDERE